MENTRVASRAETYSRRYINPGRFNTPKPVEKAVEKPKNIFENVTVIENYDQQALTKMTAENFSGRKIERIDVYTPGRKEMILGTDLQPHTLVETMHGQMMNNSIFYSAIRAVPPYELVAIARRDGENLSGRIEVNKDGKLKIEFTDHASTMNLYTMDEKTLIDSVELTPNPVHPSQGMHPLA